MNKLSIKKAVYLFVKNELNGKIDFNTLSQYVNRLGYVIIFFRPDVPDNIAVKYNLTEKLLNYPALTVRRKSAKYIFINSTYSFEQKMIFLVHEIAHLFLGHLDTNKDMIDKELHELQADAFAYALLNYKSKKMYFVLLAVIAAALVMLISGIAYHKHTLQQNEKMVYITSTGECYHTDKCIFTKEKSPTALTELEAKKDYKPCRVCNP